MSFVPSSPLTGSAQIGFTSPTYTFVTDSAPDQFGKQVAVTALGGTQAGVTVNTVSSPFTLTFVRPKVLRLLGKANHNGFFTDIPRNVWRLITRKGVTPAANQPATNLLITTTVEVPAGADTYDAANVKAALSAHIGMLTQQSAGIGDSAITGVS